MRFVFNGAELQEPMTLAFCDVSDGGSIVARPFGGRDSECLASPWLMITRDTDSFNDSARVLLNPETARDACTTCA